MNKPRLKIVLGIPIEVPVRETPVQSARRRHGKQFSFEPGSAFKWTSGPTVLDAWLFNRKRGAK